MLNAWIMIETLRRTVEGQPMEQLSHGDWIAVETDNWLTGKEPAFPPTPAYWEWNLGWVFLRDPMAATLHA